MTRWGRGNFILEFCETKTNVTNRHQSKFMWSSIFPMYKYQNYPSVRVKCLVKCLVIFILLVTQEAEQPECSLLKFVGITSCKVVKSSQLPATSLVLASYSA